MINTILSFSLTTFLFTLLAGSVAFAKASEGLELKPGYKSVSDEGFPRLRIPKSTYIKIDSYDSKRDVFKVTVEENPSIIPLYVAAEELSQASGTAVLDKSVSLKEKSVGNFLTIDREILVLFADEYEDRVKPHRKIQVSSN